MQTVAAIGGTQPDWNAVLGRPPQAAVSGRPFPGCRGARVLLTGAGGSIGSALARSLVEAGVGRLVLLDASEAALFAVANGLQDPGDLLHPVLGSVCDRRLLDGVFRRQRPEIVVHAAAFKHVALLEHNPVAAVRNNTQGSWVLAQAAIEHRASGLLFVSTDKAVDPASAMGASKRAAELALFSLARTSSCRINVLRLCNVMGSSGSVAPLMMDRIVHGRPVTVTDRMAARFFISMADAVAAAHDVLAQPGTGKLFAPPAAMEMNILALAERMIGLFAPPAPRPEVVFTGLRSGERLREKLIGDDERWAAPQDGTATLRSGIGEVAPIGGWPVPAPSSLASLWRALEGRDAAAALNALCEIVPQYRPSPLVERQCGLHEGTP